MELTLYFADGEEIPINLETWQAEAIIQLLGIQISPAVDTSSKAHAYDVTMNSKQFLLKLLQSLNGNNTSL